MWFSFSEMGANSLLSYKLANNLFRGHLPVVLSYRKLSSPATFWGGNSLLSYPIGSSARQQPLGGVTPCCPIPLEAKLALREGVWGGRPAGRRLHKLERH